MGYLTVNEAYYFGYNLNRVTSAGGIFHSIDISKTFVHDIHFINYVKQAGLNNCTLIGCKGHLSKTYQTDLFNSVRIDLKTPMRKNQQNKERFEPIFRRF